MLEVKRLSPTDAPRWDAFVRGHPAATAFHLTAWARSIEATFGHHAYLLYAEEGGNIVGILPLVHIKSQLFGNNLISVAFAVYGGPLADRADVHGALDVAAESLRDRLGANAVEYRNLVRCRPERPAQSELYATFIRAIDADPEVNMKAIPRKQRAMVRKAMAFGLEWRIDADGDTHYRLYSESLRNLGTPAFPRAHFSNLQQAYGKDCDILTVTYEDRPVVSVMSFYFRDQVLPYYAGGGDDARRLAANDFMYWALTEHARRKGYGVFDFGRSKVGTGAYAFKKNWGFEPRPLHYEYLLAPGAAIPEVNPLNPKYQAMIKVWQRLPLVVANRLGPLVVRNLG